MRKRQATFGVIRDIIQMANPTFVLIAVFLPIGGLIYALNFGSITSLNYVHIMAGALWTGIDLFLGFVLGPILGGMEPKDRAGLFKRLIPRMTFLMPVLATVTIMGGIELTQQLGYSFSNPWIIAAAVIAALLTIQGFGLMLPNEIRIFRQLMSKTPSIDTISRLGMRNAKLGGLQGIFQLAIIFIMANIRF